MNLGKTYVDGGWKPGTGSDLHSVLHVLRVNFEKILTRNRWSLSQSVTALFRSWNSLVASRRNVAHHYDLDETLFRTCLDHDMHYSCLLSEPERRSGAGSACQVPPHRTQVVPQTGTEGVRHWLRLG